MKVDTHGWHRCFGAVVFVLALMAVLPGPGGAGASEQPPVLSAAEINYPPFLIPGYGYVLPQAHAALQDKLDEGLLVLLLGLLLWSWALHRQVGRKTRQMQESETRFRTLFMASPVSIIIFDKDTGAVVDANQTAWTSYGLATLEELQAGEFWLDPPYSLAEALEWNRKAATEGSQCFEWMNRKASGEIFWEQVRLVPLSINGMERVMATSIDITERKRVRERLEKSEQQYRELVENAPIGIFQATPKGQYIAVNPEGARIFGYGSPAEMTAQVTDIARQIYLHPSDRERYMEILFTQGSVKNYEVQMKRRDGSNFWVSKDVTLRRDTEGRFFFDKFLRDITYHKQAEKEQERLRAQLFQAQKMESVGRLTGGVAHDFNNMLQAILINTELALARTDPADPRHGYLQEVINAAMRSTNLIRQLLAFARRQPAAPVALDLNNTVEGMLQMLRRLMGEDIDLDWRPGPGLWTVKMDQAQVDQVLANLCVNARDAIAGPGKTTIETDNVTLDRNYCAGRTGFIPGEYVLLAVSDNGCGMDKATMEQIYDPFFTTKEPGQGTGLGLSTVYGIVKQNDGFINVYSEPGQGTTFRIYLPRHGGPAQVLEGQDLGRIPCAQGETVMVVEDDAIILDLCREILEGLGFAVLPAATPQAALDLAEAHAGKIDLLLTDVVMPMMNGRDLAKRLHALHPELKVLFMSGYTANVIAHHGVLAQGVQFIQKPFTMHALGGKVRAVLDRGRPTEPECTLDPRPPVLRLKSLAALPRAMLRAMREAVEDGDMNMLRDLISQAAVVDQSVAEGLKALADQYEYEGLLEILGKAMRSEE